MEQNEQELHYHATGEVQSLLNDGVALDGKTSDDLTPSMMADEIRSEREVNELLIRSGEDIQWRGVDGGTLLRYASSKGWLEIVQSLVEKRAVLDMKNSKGETPLIMAAAKEGSSLEVVELLINSGADIECRDEDGWTVLHHAASQGSVEIVQCLANKVISLEVKNCYGETPLILAAQFACEEVFKVLANSGANIHCYDHNGWTVLHHASFQGSVEIADYLVNKGVALNAKNTEGQTPLMLGAQMMCEEVIGLLVESGADIHCCDDNGMTALHHASFEGSVETVQCLVNHGVALDMKNSDGKSPLHLAVQMEEIEIAECLLKAGADCNIEDNDCQSPFDFLVEQNTHFETIKLCIEKGARVKTTECTLLEAHLREKFILQFSNLSLQAGTNELHDKYLSLIYESLPAAQEISDIGEMKIESCSGAAQKVNKGVTHEIQAEGF